MDVQPAQPPPFRGGAACPGGTPTGLGEGCLRSPCCPSTPPQHPGSWGRRFSQRLLAGFTS